MIETCTFIIPPLSNSFFKHKLVELGILDEWIEISMRLFDDNLEGKLLSYKFMGQIMNYLPEVINSN